MGTLCSLLGVIGVLGLGVPSRGRSLLITLKIMFFKYEPLHVDGEYDPYLYCGL